MFSLVYFNKHVWNTRHYAGTGDSQSDWRIYEQYLTQTGRVRGQFPTPERSLGERAACAKWRRRDVGDSILGKRGLVGDSILGIRDSRKKEKHDGTWAHRTAKRLILLEFEAQGREYWEMKLEMGGGSQCVMLRNQEFAQKDSLKGLKYQSDMVRVHLGHSSPPYPRFCFSYL